MNDRNLSEEEKNVNMVVNDIEVFQKMKRKSLLSIEKIILKYKNKNYLILLLIITNRCIK